MHVVHSVGFRAAYLTLVLVIVWETNALHIPIGMECFVMGK